MRLTRPHYARTTLLRIMGADAATITKIELVRLTADNFDDWEESLANMCYALDWPFFETATTQPMPQTVLTTVPTKRKKAWGVITASLPPDIRRHTAGLDKGDVEQLILTVTELFYRQTSNGKDIIRKQIQDSKLEQFGDVRSYISYVHGEPDEEATRHGLYLRT